MGGDQGAGRLREVLSHRRWTAPGQRAVGALAPWRRRRARRGQGEGTLSGAGGPDGGIGEVGFAPVRKITAPSFFSFSDI